MLAAAYVVRDIGLLADDDLIGIGSHHERRAIATDEFAGVFLSGRGCRQIRSVPRKPVRRQELNCPAKRLDALRVRDLLKQSDHHCGVTGGRENARPDHPFLADHTEMESMADLARQRFNKNSLRAPIALAVRVQVVEFHQQECRFPCEFGLRQSFEEIGSMKPLQNPLRFMFQQVGRRKVGYWTPGKLGLAEQSRPELTGPGIDVLENVFVNCL